MTKVEDVVRWSADPDAPAGMRELVRAANAADSGPSAAAIASMRGRVVAQLAPKAALLSVRALIVGVLVVGAGAGIVGYALTRPGRPAARMEVPAVARVESPPPVAAPAPPPTAPPALDVTQTTSPATASVAPAPPVIAQRPPSAKPAARAATPPPVPAARAATAPVPAAAAVETPPTPTVVETPPAPPSPPAVSEVTLLEQARVALRSGNSARALELTGQHATSYPDGALAEEREALAIEALAKLGRHADAAARWAKFASSYPHSNYRPRLQRTIDNSR